MDATQELAERIENIKNDVKTDREALLRTITRLLNEKAALEAQLTAANQTITDLHEFAYERAPKIAAEAADRQTADLRAEVERLRQELGYIANARRDSFTGADEFREWAQSRARHALGQKPGELTIKKEKGHE